MATLNIGGQRVKVDDAFLSMTPEQQQATVEEIASQLAPAQEQSGFSRLMAGEDAANLERSENVVMAAPPKASPWERLRSASGGMWEGVPIIGKPIADALATGDAYINSLLNGGSPEANREAVNQRQEQAFERAPEQRTLGNVVGGVGTYAVGGAPAMGAKLLGMSGNIGSRIGFGLGSGAALSAGDTAVRGGDAGDIATSGLIGGGLGGAIPVVGAGVKAVLNPLVQPIAQTFGRAMNPTRAAATIVGEGVERGRASGSAMTAADEATARANNQPVLNVDRGGEPTRAIMRSAANQNPEARATVERMSEDRFRTQGSRLGDFLTRLVGGNVDDVGFREGLRATARRVNKPAYEAIRNRTVNFTPEIAAVVRTPMGEEALRKAAVMMQNDGLPVDRLTVQWLDYTKRALDDIVAANTSINGAVNNVGRQARDMAAKLTGAVDSAVPAYKTARQGAALFFGAEDALDAGKKAWQAPKSIDETRRAWQAMSQAEQDAFRVGLVGEVMDQVRSVNNRANVTRVFDIDAKKELLELALGPAKAREFEAFLRVEDIMDKMRGALGNSTTARQLVELGLTTGVGAGVGFVGSGGNLNSAGMTAALFAAGRYGFKHVKGKVDDKVLQKVAEMLASGDEQLIQNALANAALSRQHMLALQAIQRGIGATARGAALEATPRPSNEITVRGGNPALN